MKKVIAINPYDSQSQVIYDISGIAPALCCGTKRWGGLAPRILEERGITMKLTEEAIKTLLQAGEKMHADCGKVHLYLDKENYDEVLSSVGDMANKDWKIHML